MQRGGFVALTHAMKDKAGLRLDGLGRVLPIEEAGFTGRVVVRVVGRGHFNFLKKCCSSKCKASKLLLACALLQQAVNFAPVRLTLP